MCNIVRFSLDYYEKKAPINLAEIRAILLKKIVIFMVRRNGGVSGCLKMKHIFVCCFYNQSLPKLVGKTYQKFRLAYFVFLFQYPAKGCCKSSFFINFER